MKRAVLTLLIINAALLSCSREETDRPGQESAKHTLSFETGPVVPDDGSTKVLDNIAGTKHSFTWQAGDKIRLFAFKTPVAAGESKAEDLGTFTAQSSGSSTTFKGEVGDVNHEYTKLYAVYPDRPEVTFVQPSTAADYYLLRIKVDQTQSGNALDHCYFTSYDGVFAPETPAVTTAPTFKLCTPITRMTVTSSKDISHIVISSSLNFAGTMTLHSNAAGIFPAGDASTITLRNGVILIPASTPTTVSWASRQIPKDCTLTFTFYSTDGATAAKTYVSPQATAANQILNLGSITISAGDWAEGEKASAAVPRMGVGVNLCGSFDDVLNGEGELSGDRADPSTFETSHGQSLTTATTMTSLYSAGFRTIRIPITWYAHMDSPTSTIDAVFLDRIEEVVNYALDAGLYCIINVHHDAGSNKNRWIYADIDDYPTITTGFQNVWGQIAERFRDYSFKLLFEGYNEILDKPKRWFIPTAATSYTAANNLNQDFVNVVRATGGNNASRNLIVTTYSASTWEDALSNFSMPTDAVTDHLMVQIHSYKPDAFCTANTNTAVYTFEESDKATVDEVFNLLQANILDKGYPCVMGEYGAFPMAERIVNNDAERCEHAEYYTTKCLQKGIVPIYWFNPMVYGQRSLGTWTYPYLKDAIIGAYNDWLSQ
ncbi:MAG: cellulase family glycosylhydrolase [Bacteroidales bacterium]|nr:cellulase family glycosylhydrolase [Bacteroidales bacterium]